MYWIGVVEDRHDPLFSGRVRVRVYGYHNEDLSVLPTEDLPWATVVASTASAGTSGLGESPSNLIEGSTVLGMFMDGDNAQVPVVLGSIFGVPLRKASAQFGFRDPELNYPKDEYLGQPDVNKLARNQDTGSTSLLKRREDRTKDVPIAFGGSWDQPDIPYAARYPYNHVQETESGHLVEMDDTKGAERLHWYHTAGTYREIDANGTTVDRIVGDHYEIVARGKNVYVRGSCNITVRGDTKIYAQQNCDVQVDGNLKIHAHGSIEMKAGRSITMVAGGSIGAYATGGNMSLTAANRVSILGQRVTVSCPTKITLAAPVTEAAVIKINGLAITPIPPIPQVIIPPSRILEKSVSGIRLPTLKNPPTTAPSPAIPNWQPVTEATVP